MRRPLADKKGFVPDYADFKHLGEGHRDAWMKAYRVHEFGAEEEHARAFRRALLGIVTRDLLDRTEGSWGGAWRSVVCELALGLDAG